MTTDAWSTLDELLGLEALADQVPEGAGIGPLAFYGRCSTEDNQDPRTSLSWQLAEAKRFVEPLGGQVVEEFFDIGQSRSLPWERRDEGARLLAALKDPRRGWDGLVVGEATRCWYSNQFSLTWPKFHRYGVSIWIPSLGGQFDPENTVHDMAMTITGGLSKSERQHVQRRVRAAMAAQVLIDGKHQGGRAPYGYCVVDAGPHPNPRKAQEGYRLRVLDVDPEAAPVVERIFALYLDGTGHKAIAEILNRDGVPCPSAHMPRQNRHRRGDGWQHATVRAILDNPKYTGYAIYGRWQKVEELLDPDDVAAGHVVRFRRTPQSKVVRSREPSHPAIVSVEDFTRVQLAMRARAGGGRAGWSSLERTRVSSKRTYLLRGLLRCSLCGRKMEGAARKHAVLYRCSARTLVPGSEVAASHPPHVYLREDHVCGALNEWIGRLFAPEHRDATIDALADADDTGERAAAHAEALRQRVAGAESTMRRLQKALDAGWDPESLRDQYNAAVADKRAAEADIAAVPNQRAVNRDELRTMIDAIGDMTRAINEAEPQDLADLYQALRLSMIYDHAGKAIEATIRPTLCVDKSGVRGGT